MAAFACLSAMPAFAHAATLLGDAAVAPGVDTDASGLAEAFKITNAVAGTVDTLNVCSSPAAAVPRALPGWPTDDHVRSGLGDLWDVHQGRHVRRRVHRLGVARLPRREYWVQSRTAALSNPLTTTTISDTAPTSDRWNLAAVEIVP